MKTQDPKFTIENDRLIGQSGIVPDDEPLFILRARDVNAVATLKEYLRLACRSCDTDHTRAICKRISDFDKFKKEYPDRMKIPDTDFNMMTGGKP